MRLLITLLAVLAGSGCSPDSDVSRVIGARCDAKDECEEMCLPDGTEFPGGFCTQSCLRTADCPSGAVCVAEGTGGVCLFACATEGGCDFMGPGWSCLAKDGMPEGEVMVCIGED